MSEDSGLSRRLFIAGLAALPFAGCTSGPHPLQSDYDRAVTLFRQGKHDEAFKLFDEMILAEPANAGLYNDRGALRAVRGEWGHAVRDFKLAIALEPDYARPYLNRGKVYRVLANNWQVADTNKALEYRELAITDLETALRIDRALPQAYLQLGLTYDENNDGQKAYDALDKGLKLIQTQPKLGEKLDAGIEERVRTRHRELQKVYGRDL